MKVRAERVNRLIKMGSKYMCIELCMEFMSRAEEIYKNNYIPFIRVVYIIHNYINT